MRATLDFLLNDWLRDVALACQGHDHDFAQAKRAAMHYVFALELPKTGPWLAVAATRNPVCREMRDEWF